MGWTSVVGGVHHAPCGIPGIPYGTVVVFIYQFTALQSLTMCPSCVHQVSIMLFIMCDITEAGRPIIYCCHLLRLPQIVHISMSSITGDRSGAPYCYPSYGE